MARTHRSRSSSVRERRRHRERAIVEATRATFDRRMRRDASVDELAHRAGLSKALVYRAFDSKEEIFVLTLTDYLGELATRLQTPPDGGPVDELRAVSTCYAEFCLEYPAFVDCAMALMQRPASELREEVSGAIWRRLGGALASCVGPMQRILRDGADQGLFKVEEPDYLANRLCVQMLGSVHLARSGMGVRETAPGVAGLFEIDPRRVVDDCVSDALALVGVREGAPA
jgi:AcrR family transcriptional regulator